MRPTRNTNHRTSGAPAIEAVGLAKRYGDTHALTGLDLIAPAGQVTAVLGPTAQARRPS